MLLLVLVFASLVGFSVNRGSICIVRATHEILDKKPPKTMIFILEGITVALAFTLSAILLFPENIKLATSVPISTSLIAGSIIYGIGASLNGGCALGTINSLMRGNFNYLATLLGMVFGYYGYIEFFPVLDNTRGSRFFSLKDNATFFIPILIIVWGIIIWRARKYFTDNIYLKKRFQQFLTSPVARDFIAVFCIGVASAGLYLILGHSWNYTYWIMVSQKILFGVIEYNFNFLSVSVALVGFMLGVTIATFLSKSFDVHAIRLRSFALKILGGGLLGIGAGLIPGGNDTLILYDLVGLGMHAPFAILIIGVTIAGVYKAKKYV